MTRPQPDDDGSHQMFGPPPAQSTYWSQPDPNAAPKERQEGDGDLEVDLGDGMTFTIPKSAMDEIKKSEAFQEKAASVAAMVAAEAMKNAQVDGAVYQPILRNGEWSVIAANQAAEQAEAAHASLTTAMTTVRARLDARPGQ